MYFSTDSTESSKKGLDESYLTQNTKELKSYTIS